MFNPTTQEDKNDNDMGDFNVNTLHCAMKLPNMVNHETNTAWLSFCIYHLTKVIMRLYETSSKY